MDTKYQLQLDEKELQALEVIMCSVDLNKIVNTNELALSVHQIKLSDLFLTLEKIKDFIHTNLKREDE